MPTSKDVQYKPDNNAKNSCGACGGVTPERLGAEIIGGVVTSMDITERKQAEESLQCLARQNEMILNSAGEGIWGVDTMGNATFLNTAAARMLGYEPRELIGCNTHALLHHTKADGQPHRVEQCPLHVALHDGLTHRCDDDVFWRKDGSGFPVQYVCNPMIEEGKVVGVVVVFVDITVRKQAQKALQESELRFRELAENINEVFWMTDVELEKMLYVSPRYEEIWDRPCASLLSSPLDWTAAVHPEERAQVKQAFASKTICGEYDEEYRIVRPDGSVRWIRDRAFPVKDADGNVYRIAGLAADITDRKEAEKVLREQAELLNLAQDEIMVRDLDGRILFWNRGAERIYGWTAEEADGRTAVELLRTDPEKNAVAREQAVTKGEWSGELEQLRKDGTPVMVNARWTLVRDDAGEPKNILVINRDVTYQKKLEARILRAQRMESIGTLASAVAHDLNNILAPILMATSMLRGDLPAEIRDQILAAIDSSAERGAEIVKQVLTFGRGITGEHVPLQLKHLVREMEKIVIETFPKNIAIHNKLASELSLIEGDSTQIHQVLLNLFLNARDAMPQGGTLTISAENFEVDESYAVMFPDAKGGSYVRFAVTDTGSGIPPDILDKIFDPFFTTKEVGKGTGLGLSTVVGIVKSHVGFLNVYSEVGKGTTFEVFLPTATGEERRRASFAEITDPRGHGEKILVVDDESSLRVVAEAILRKNGYDVVVAADGAEATAIYAQQGEEIALVLTDVLMPLMDGVALSCALRRLNPHVRIIASTGQSEEPRKDELKSLGVEVFLSKPYNAQKFLKTIHEVLTAP